MKSTEHFTLGGRRGHGGLLQIGLLNNMPDSGLRATELQFARLLKDAAGAMDVRLRLFSSGHIARSNEMRARMQGFYDDAALLPEASLDALIVAGDPQADMLAQPYSGEMAALVQWAQTNTLSALFTGSAALAAPMMLDGIAPHVLPRRLAGVFTAARAEDDPLFFHVAPSLRVPHLRGGDIGEAELSAGGYRILSRLSDGGVNIFTRETPGQSRMVFCLGHPEQDEAVLGRDYLRAMDAFMRGEAATAPSLPLAYFDRATEARLETLAGAGDLAGLAETVHGALPLQSWRQDGVRLLGNWLTLTASAKMRRANSRVVHLRRRAS